MNNTDNWTLFFDGACEPRNPGGHMSWAWVLERPGQPVLNGTGFRAASPANTNNVSEYIALQDGLRAAFEAMSAEDHPLTLVIHGDSRMVCMQLSGLWKCRKDHLRLLLDECLQIKAKIGSTFSVFFNIQWIPREQNEVADALCRVAYRRATGHEMRDRHKEVA